VAAALVVALVWLGGFRMGQSPVGNLVHQKVSLRRQLRDAKRLGASEVAALDARMQTLLRNRARCYTDESDIQNIQRLIAQASYEVAASLAELDLTNVNKRLCPGTQAGLASMWYQSRINGLLATPPTTPMDPTPVLAWEGIERRAQAFGLTSSERLSPLTIFTMSYNNHLWQLAKASFQVAWGDQLVGPSDLTLIQTYYADLTNLGLAMTRQIGLRDRISGYSLLATAAAIGNGYGVGGEATSDLRNLLRGRRWPRPDWSDPILATTRHHRFGG
jgi:hypothetical protein